MSIRISESQNARLLAELNHDVQELHAQIEPDLFKRYSTDDMEKLFADMLEAGDTNAFIAYYDDIPAGYILLCEKSYNESYFRFAYKALYIDQLCVKSSYRGKKVGKQLIDKAKAYAKERGINRIELDFWNKNVNAGQFFRSQGFEPSIERMCTII